ncbi:Cobyrinic acid ac-diamide synthase, partial [gut metagenome]
MRILFASGKGGAGKTTVTAGIAALWPKPCVVADADVEAPDLAIFLKPTLTAERTIELDVPVAVDASRCNLCGECIELCQFNA